VSELGKEKNTTEEFMKRIKKMTERKVNIIIVKFGECRSGMSETDQLKTLI